MIKICSNLEQFQLEYKLSPSDCESMCIYEGFVKTWIRN